jgi:hypothetical protein
MLLLGTAIAGASSHATVTPPAAPAVDSARSLTAASDAVQPGLVRVEVRLRPDRGEEPSLMVGRRWCSGCGRFHGDAASQLLAQERPLEIPGFLIGPDLVLAHDPMVPARFIESISVVGSGDRVAASLDGAALREPGVFLKLERALADARPLRFAAASSQSDPTVLLRWGPDDGVWKLTASPAGPRSVVEHLADGSLRRWRTTESDSLLLLLDGQVSQLSLGGRWPEGEANAADPAQWPRLDRAGLERLRRDAVALADGSVLRTTLHFRSPRQTRGQSSMDFFGDGEGGAIGTELETLSIVLEGGHTLVLAALGPAETARLEAIELHDAQGRSHMATFVATLRELGAMVAATPEPLTGSGLPVAVEEPLAFRDRALPAATVRMLGRSRVSHGELVRMVGFEKGWKGLVLPTGIADEESTIIFSPDGALLAAPIAARRKVAMRTRWDSEASPALMPSSALAAVLEDINAASDPSNVPLTEEDEGRTAWLGVMLQPLDPELATANGVADVTRGGEFGGIVTFVYPDSPAEAAGIAPGAVVLALHAPGQPKPIEVEVEESDLGYGGVFPWEHLDQLPEEYFDEIPPPWPRIEDRLATTLIELGLGTAYELEVVESGTARRVPLTVVQSPPHFENAPRFESKPFGFTVRDLTIEVRNHLGLQADAPGVVISALEPGKRGSVAGLRPFEIITDVDGAPVTGAAQFGSLLEGKDSVKLAVRRANMDRVVQLSAQ